MVSLVKFKNIPLKDKPPTNNQPIPLSVVPPQEALVPIWNSPFYATPDEPADPRDCDRYPDSIYCGGFPWTWTPVGIEPSIVLDDCNVGIELAPVLAWTKLPPVQIVYRKQSEECRLKPPIPRPTSVSNDFIPYEDATDPCLYLLVTRSYGAEIPSGNGVNDLVSGRVDYVQGSYLSGTLCWGEVGGLGIQNYVGSDNSKDYSLSDFFYPSQEMEAVHIHFMYARGFVGHRSLFRVEYKEESLDFNIDPAGILHGFSNDELNYFYDQSKNNYKF